MIHAFKRIGVPTHVLTDNMKSVVLHRDSEGHPVWNHDYEVFMNTIGFETKLCRPRHPFTKGAVERLVRFVKENFLAGRVFGTITDLNYEAWKWCDNQNNRYHKAVDCIPHERHRISCMKTASPTACRASGCFPQRKRLPWNRIWPPLSLARCMRPAPPSSARGSLRWQWQKWLCATAWSCTAAAP